MSQIYNFLKHVSPEIHGVNVMRDLDNIILTENLRVASATKQAKRKESNIRNRFIVICLNYIIF